MTMPHSAAAKPEVALRNEMSTGMSAPPTRIEKTTPMRIDATNVPKIAIAAAEPVSVPAAKARATTATIIATRIRS